MVCRHCGKEIADGVLVCGYCGHAVPQQDLSTETKEKIEREKCSDESLKPNTGASIRAFGIALMIISGIFDVIGMVLIGTGTFEAFNAVTIISTVAFFIGLVMTFAFR